MQGMGSSLQMHLDGLGLKTHAPNSPFSYIQKKLRYRNECSPLNCEPLEIKTHSWSAINPQGLAHTGTVTVNLFVSLIG